MGTAFTIMPIFFVVFMTIVVGIVVFAVVKGLGQWNRNNQSPVLTVEATVTGKRTHRDHGMAGDDMMSSGSTTYYATFEVPSGSRMEFCVQGREYGLLREGDQGALTFQGTRYLRFDRRF